ncbi:hypothetical protein [Arenimonas sp. MALMAid1274]|uniref:hypothetical protein n=1 Tax=Arenimonas sp. MALMAid1274 TaxID=3411630 RepID=UPI003BA148E2
MNKHPCKARSLLAFASLALVPGQALASDFSGLMFIAYAITAILALPIAGVIYLLTRKVKSIWKRALAWGPLLALVATPLKTDGGNGTSSGPPLLDLVIVAFGGDPVYAVEAIKALAISVPAFVALVALWLWARPRPEPDPNPPSGS